MSALAKPLIHTVAASNLVNGVSPVVNVENIKDISTVDIPKMGNTKAKYLILFTVLSSENQIKTVTWEFTVQATRNTKFAAAVALASAAV